jgi:hypothetical protein
MAVKSIISYVLLFIPSLFLVAGLWTAAVAGRLYYCWDSVPFLDFVPPFVHADVDPRDHYIASVGAVWALWICLLLFALVLPLMVLWVLRAWRASLRDGTTI